MTVYQSFTDIITQYKQNWWNFSRSKSAATRLLKDLDSSRGDSKETLTTAVWECFNNIDEESSPAPYTPAWLSARLTTLDAPLAIAFPSAATDNAKADKKANKLSEAKKHRIKKSIEKLLIKRWWYNPDTSRLSNELAANYHVFARPQASAQEIAANTIAYVKAKTKGSFVENIKHYIGSLRHHFNSAIEDFKGLIGVQVDPSSPQVPPAVALTAAHPSTNRVGQGESLPPRVNANWFEQLVERVKNLQRTITDAGSTHPHLEAWRGSAHSALSSLRDRWTAAQAREKQEEDERAAREKQEEDARAEAQAAQAEAAQRRENAGKRSFDDIVNNRGIVRIYHEMSAAAAPLGEPFHVNFLKNLQSLLAFDKPGSPAAAFLKKLESNGSVGIQLEALEYVDQELIPDMKTVFATDPRSDVTNLRSVFLDRIDQGVVPSILYSQLYIYALLRALGSLVSDASAMQGGEKQERYVSIILSFSREIDAALHRLVLENGQLLNFWERDVLKLPANTEPLFDPEKAVLRLRGVLLLDEKSRVVGRYNPKNQKKEEEGRQSGSFSTKMHGTILGEKIRSMFETEELTKKFKGDLEILNTYQAAGAATATLITKGYPFGVCVRRWLVEEGKPMIDIRKNFFSSVDESLNTPIQSLMLTYFYTLVRSLETLLQHADITDAGFKQEQYLASAVAICREIDEVVYSGVNGHAKLSSNETFNTWWNSDMCTQLRRFVRATSLDPERMKNASIKFQETWGLTDEGTKKLASQHLSTHHSSGSSDDQRVDAGRSVAGNDGGGGAAAGNPVRRRPPEAGAAGAAAGRAAPRGQGGQAADHGAGAGGGVAGGGGGRAAAPGVPVAGRR